MDIALKHGTIPPSPHRIITKREAMTYRFHHTVFLAIFFCLAGTYIRINAATLQAGQPHAIVEAKVIQNEILWPYLIGGALLGGYACVGFRKLDTRMEAARYFGVSFAVAMVVSPFILYDTNIFGLVNEPKWSGAVACSGCVAFGAWALLELLTMAAMSCKKAMEERGIQGLRDQIVLLLSFGIIRLNQGTTPDQKP